MGPNDQQPSYFILIYLVVCEFRDWCDFFQPLTGF
jgi:hypothetical protein